LVLESVELFGNGCGWLLRQGLLMLAGHSLHFRVYALLRELRSPLVRSTLPKVCEVKDQLVLIGK
jgi:hypothetical protein